MNPDTKKRLFGTFTSLCLLFALLALYYKMSVPTEGTAFLQAMIAAVLLAGAAVVFWFLPADRPLDASQAPPADEERLWSPEPRFEAELAATLASAVTPIDPVPQRIAAPILSAPFPVPVPTAVPQLPTPPVAPPLALPAAATPAPPAIASTQQAPAEPVETELARIEKTPTAESPLEFSDLRHVFVGGRNDDVLVYPAKAPKPPAEPPPIVVPLTRPAAATSMPAEAKAEPKPADRAAATQPETGRDVPRTGPVNWSEPDPDSPRELLRELVDYWHMKYVHEHDRSETLWDLVRDAEAFMEASQKPHVPAPTTERPATRASTPATAAGEAPPTTEGLRSRRVAGANGRDDEQEDDGNEQQKERVAGQVGQLH